jgi:YD repeat-containing protein
MDTATYLYDLLGRLKKITWANGTTQEFFYDQAGNRTSVVTTCPSGTC